jgi:hypothetical protein
MILSLLFLSIAAVLNAVMDSVEYDTAFERSIFSRYNPKWWCKSISWKYVKFIPLTKYRADAWHLAKSGMVVFIILSVLFYQNQIHVLLAFLLYGAVWNLVFNLFYNKIFRK